MANRRRHRLLWSASGAILAVIWLQAYVEAVHYERLCPALRICHFCEVAVDWRVMVGCLALVKLQGTWTQIRHSHCRLCSDLAATRAGSSSLTCIRRGGCATDPSPGKQWVGMFDGLDRRRCWHDDFVLPCHSKPSGRHMPIGMVRVGAAATSRCGSQRLRNMLLVRSVRIGVVPS